MKAEYIRDLAKEEIEQRLSEAEEELFNLKLRKHAQKLDNPLRLRVLGRDVARLKTILHEHKKGIRVLSASTGKILESKSSDADKKEKSKE